MAQAHLLHQLGRAERGGEHRLDVDVLGRERRRGAGILIHHLREQVLIERAPVHADTHRLPVLHGQLHDRPEVLVAQLAADIPWIDPVLVQRARAVGVAREQQVPVVVEVTDDGH